MSIWSSTSCFYGFYLSFFFLSFFFFFSSKTRKKKKKKENYSKHLEECESKPECIAIVDYGFGPVTRILDPGIFFLFLIFFCYIWKRSKLNKTNKELVKNLRKKTKEVQSPEIIEKKSWTVGDKCIFESWKDGLLHDGVIKEIKDEMYKVKMFDTNQIEDLKECEIQQYSFFFSGCKKRK